MEKFKFDVISKTLTITAKFAEAMNNPGSEEYKLYQKFNADFPNLKVIGKTHRPPTTYITKSNEKFHHNPYKGITVENMEQFPKYRTEPFYYFNNHPTLIPFQPSNNENSEPELAATGTEG